MADDSLSSVLAEIRERDQRVWDGRGTDRGPLAITKAKDDTPRLLAAVEAALGFHQRVELYGNAATDDEPGACPHDPDDVLHFEDAEEPGEWLCRGKPEGEVCGTCTEDELPVAWPCPEYQAVAAALTGKEADGATQPAG